MPCFYPVPCGVRLVWKVCGWPRKDPEVLWGCALLSCFQGGQQASQAGMTLTPECRPPTPQQDLTLICFSGDEIVCTGLKDELSEVEQRWRGWRWMSTVYPQYHMDPRQLTVSWASLESVLKVPEHPRGAQITPGTRLEQYCILKPHH